MGETSLSGLGVYKFIELKMQWFKLNRINLPLVGLPVAFEGVKIVHLSDLHFGPWITPERFAEVVEVTHQLDPDLILITGDFIDKETLRSQVPEFIEQLKQLQARMGKFAVLGNHDHRQNASMVRQMLSQSGIIDLSNRVYPLQRGSEHLYLCGLDDYRVGAQDLEVVLESLPEQGYALLLMHEPDYADISAATSRFALQLSGHSHGGQVVIPFYGPPILPKHARKYPRGLYQVKNMTLYTNSGIGMMRPYVRINCRPEVAVFTLERVSPES